MKVSKEIKSLKKRIRKLMHYKPDYLMIGLEYDIPSKEWMATPCFEISGDGYPQYIDNTISEYSYLVLQGVGKTLPSAIRNLEKLISKCENKGFKF